jgi:hypothetical protein
MGITQRGDETVVTPEKEYLSLKELCEHIPYKPQTIYNWISDGVWELGMHYLKPTSHKLIFHWPTIVRWLEGKKLGKSTTGTRQNAGRDALL